MDDKRSTMNAFSESRPSFPVFPEEEKNLYLDPRVGGPHEEHGTDLTVG